LDNITLDHYRNISPGLSEDENRSLATRLGQICGKDELDAETAGNVVAIVRQIADTARFYIRLALAEAAAANPDLPSDIAMKIANDEDSISAPFLKLSEVLTDSDLLEIARLTDSNIKRVAISQRKVVSEELSGVLADTGNWRVRKTLLGNEGAQIGGATYDLIIARDGNLSELHSVIVEGRQLPVNIVAKFIRVMEVSLIDKLITRHALTPAQAFALATEVHCDALFGLASDISADRLAALVQFLSARGEISPYLLFKAICSGNMQFLATYLAQCSEMPVAQVQERLGADHAVHLPILWRTTGFPEQILPLIVEAVTILKSSANDCRKRDIKVQQTLIFQRLVSGLETMEKRLSPVEIRDLWAAYA